MKILMLSEDPNILFPGSEAHARMWHYSFLFDGFFVALPTKYKNAKREHIDRLSIIPVYAIWVWLARIRLFTSLYAICAEEHFDVISVQSPNEIGFIGFILSKIYKSRFQIQIHTDIFSYKQKTSSWKARLRWRLARFLIPRADLIRVVSKRIADSLYFKLNIPYSRITILPIFVYVKAFYEAKTDFKLHDKYPDFKFIILMVSRLSAEKNIKLALEAFSQFVKKFPKSESGLIIVGEGQERKNLESRIHNLELSHNVRLVGWKDKIIPYYKGGADLYLLTSDFEGYGRSVVEAVAAGLPVIMTDVGVAGDVVSDLDTGRVVGVGNIKELTAALVWAYENPTKMGEMAKKAQGLLLGSVPLDPGDYLDMYKNSFQS